MDFFLTADGLIVNELNTMPGFTPISMFPKCWLASGMTYPELISELVDTALERGLIAALGESDDCVTAARFHDAEDTESRYSSVSGWGAAHSLGLGEYRAGEEVTCGCRDRRLHRRRSDGRIRRSHTDAEPDVRAGAADDVLRWSQPRPRICVEDRPFIDVSVILVDPNERSADATPSR